MCIIISYVVCLFVCLIVCCGIGISIDSSIHSLSSACGGQHDDSCGLLHRHDVCCGRVLLGVVAVMVLRPCYDRFRKHHRRCDLALQALHVPCCPFQFQRHLRLQPLLLAAFGIHDGMQDGVVRDPGLVQDAVALLRRQRHQVRRCRVRRQHRIVARQGTRAAHHHGFHLAFQLLDFDGGDGCRVGTDGIPIQAHWCSG